MYYVLEETSFSDRKSLNSFNKTINPTIGTSLPKIVIDRNKFIYNFYGYIRMK